VFGSKALIDDFQPCFSCVRRGSSGEYNDNFFCLDCVEGFGAARKLGAKLQQRLRIEVGDKTYSVLRGLV